MSKEGESQMSRQFENALRKSTESTQHSIEQLVRELAKVEGQQTLTTRKLEEMERSMSKKIEDAASKTVERGDCSAENVRTAVQAHMSTLMGRSDLIGEALRDSNHSQKEVMADLRRLIMMVLDQVNGSHDHNQQHSGQLVEMRGSLDAGLERILASVNSRGGAAALPAVNLTTGRY